MSTRNGSLQSSPNWNADAFRSGESIAIKPRTKNPYGNVIAVRTRDRDKPVFKTLVGAYQSEEIRQFILAQFDGAILPVF